MLKATPGPWIVEDPLENTLSIVQAGKATHEWWFIANCMFPDEDDHDFTAAEVKANAHLIASAPDLYEALAHTRQFILAWIPEYQEKTDPGSRAQMRRIQDAIGKVDAALKSARGEASVTIPLGK